MWVTVVTVERRLTCRRRLFTLCFCSACERVARINDLLEFGLSLSAKSSLSSTSPALPLLPVRD